ncbi:MAG TPA: hypothetical protein VHZ76_02540, partial [Gammaproteobacteria bacterium]|nr:hypothetical protein [Gammaproteobacteria bacterium]
MQLSIEEKQRIQALHENFYHHSQHIIEKHYLLPLLRDTAGALLPARTKENLRDGRIERQQHGAMHVSRAQALVLILHGIMKNSSENNKNTQDTFAYFKQTFGLDETHIIMLIRYAVLYHDAAREHEARDTNEAKNAKLYHDFLIENGLPEDFVKVFSMIVECKDDPKKYEDFLRKQGIAEECLTYYQYLRQLVALADCKDIIRCNGRFSVRIAKEIMPNFPDDDLLTVVKQMHALIRSQKDMLFGCEIILLDETVLALKETNPCYALSSKVLFEHAENACSAMMTYIIKQDAYLGEFLKPEVPRFLSTELATVQPVFQGFLHGSNSLSLALQRMTAFTFEHPITLINKFGVAPFGGEITEGGLRTLGKSSGFSFGALSSRGMNDYTLEKVLEKYTVTTSPTKELALQQAKDCAAHVLAGGCNYIDILSIYVGRAQQLGAEVFSQAELEKFNLDYNAIIQFFYLISLLGKQIHVNFPLFEGMSKEIKKDCQDAVLAHLTFKHILNKIKQLNRDHNVNIKDICDHPTTENLQLVLTLFEVPLTSTVRTSFGKKEISLSTGQFFTLNSDFKYPEEVPIELFPGFSYFDVNKNYYNADGLIQRFSRLEDLDGAHVFNMFLHDYLIGHTVHRELLEKMRDLAIKHIELLNGKLAQLNQLVNAKKVCKFTPLEKYFLEEPFPVIYICEKEENVYLYDFGEQEFRATGPVKLGEEITMIAVENTKDAAKVQEFLSQNML